MTEQDYKNTVLRRYFDITDSSEAPTYIGKSRRKFLKYQQSADEWNKMEEREWEGDPSIPGSGQRHRSPNKTFVAKTPDYLDPSKKVFNEATKEGKNWKGEFVPLLDVMRSVNSSDALEYEVMGAKWMAMAEETDKFKKMSPEEQQGVREEVRRAISGSSSAAITYRNYETEALEKIAAEQGVPFEFLFMDKAGQEIWRDKEKYRKIREQSGHNYIPVLDFASRNLTEWGIGVVEGLWNTAVFTAVGVKGIAQERFAADRYARGKTTKEEYEREIHEIKDFNNAYVGIYTAPTKWLNDEWKEAVKSTPYLYERALAHEAPNMLAKYKKDYVTLLDDAAQGLASVALFWGAGSLGGGLFKTAKAGSVLSKIRTGQVLAGYIAYAPVYASTYEKVRKRNPNMAMWKIQGIASTVGLVSMAVEFAQMHHIKSLGGKVAARKAIEKMALKRIADVSSTAGYSYLKIAIPHLVRESAEEIIQSVVEEEGADVLMGEISLGEALKNVSSPDRVRDLAGIGLSSLLAFLPTTLGGGLRTAAGKGAFIKRVMSESKEALGTQLTREEAEEAYRRIVRGLRIKGAKEDLADIQSDEVQKRLKEISPEQTKFFEDLRASGAAVKVEKDTKDKKGKSKKMSELDDEEFRLLSNFIHRRNVVQSVQRGIPIEDVYKEINISTEKGKGKQLGRRLGQEVEGIENVGPKEKVPEKVSLTKDEASLVRETMQDALLDAGEMWIGLQGQDPDDPSSWGNVGKIRNETVWNTETQKYELRSTSELDPQDVGVKKFLTTLSSYKNLRQRLVASGEIDTSEGPLTLGQSGVVDTIESVATQLESLDSKSFANISPQHAKVEKYLQKLLKSEALSPATAQLYRHIFAQQSVENFDRVVKTLSSQRVPERWKKAWDGKANKVIGYWLGSEGELWVKGKQPHIDTQIYALMHEFSHVVWDSMTKEQQNAFEELAQRIGKEFAKDPEGPLDEFFKNYPERVESSAEGLDAHYYNLEETFAVLSAYLASRDRADSLPSETIKGLTEEIQKVYKTTGTFEHYLRRIHRLDPFRDSALGKDLLKLIESVHKLGQGLGEQTTQKKVRKGEIELGKEEVVLRFFKDADVSTVLHEMGHYWRQHLSESEQVKLDSIYGVEGKWDDDTEERFARDLERFAMGGKIAHKELQPLFRKFNTWLKDIYKVANVKELKDKEGNLTTELPFEISPEVRRFFNAMFATDLTTAEGLRAAVARDTVRTLAQDNGEDKEDSKRSPRDKAYIRTSVVDAAVDSIQSLYDYTAHLRRFKTGRAFLADLSKVETLEKSMTGLFSRRLRSRFIALKKHKGLVRWLEGFEDDSPYSNLRRLTEPELDNPTLPSEWTTESKLALSEYIKLGREIQTFFWNRAVALKMVRRGKTQKMEPLKELPGGRLMRAFTPDGLNALKQENSPEGIELRRVIGELNPEMTNSQINFALKKSHEGMTRKTLGMLEYARKVKYMPDRISVEGKETHVFHVSPYELYSKAVRNQAARTAFVDVFSQGILKNVGMGRLKALAKVLNVMPSVTRAKVEEKLVDQGIPADVVGAIENMKFLRAFAKSMDISLKVTKDDIVEAIDSLGSLVGVSESKLKTQLRKLGGIDVRLEGDELLSGLKSRVREFHEDKLHLSWKAFGREGGDVRNLEKVARMAQHLPISNIGHTLGYKLSRPLSAIIGAKHVALAGVPNLVQVLQLVPGYTGYKNLAIAIGKYIRHPVNLTHQGEDLGAYTVDPFLISREKGYRFQNMGRAIRDVASRVTLLRWSLQKNNVIAAEAFRLLAEDWKKNGLKKTDMWRARDLRLTKSEINAINSSAMSDETYKKILQNGVAVTQYVTESTFRQGIVNVNPLAREAFSYQSYTGGQFRQLQMIYDHWKRGVKEKDPVLLLNVLQRTLETAVRYSVSGMLIDSLRRAMFARPPRDEDETIVERALKGMLEVQFLGPATRMLVFTGHGQKDFSTMLLGTMPKVSAIADFVDLLRSQIAMMMGEPAETIGRTGKLPLMQKYLAYERRHFGLYRVGNNIVNDFVYPDHKDYLKIRRKVGKWREKNHPRTAAPSVYQLNEKYYNIFELAKRNDLEGSQREAAKYYRGLHSQGISMKQGVINLRSSLRNYRPINLNSNDYIAFLMSLPLEKRKEAFHIDLRYRMLVNSVAPEL